MAAKKTLNLEPAQAQKLLDKGLISKATFSQIAQHFSDGGSVMVVDPGTQAVVDQAVGPSPVAPPPEASSSAPSPEQQTLDQLTAQKAQNIQTREAYGPQLDFHHRQTDQEISNQAQDQALSEMLYKRDHPTVDPQTQTVMALNTKRAQLGMTPLPVPSAPQAPSAPPQASPPAQPDPMQDAILRGMQAAGRGVDSGFGTAMAGAKNEAKAIDAQGKEMASTIGNGLNAIDQWSQGQKAIEAQRTQFFQDQTDKLNQAREDVLKASALDPERYWKNKSSLQKIGMAIGIAFSGANGQGNQALGLINNAINRDVEAQKANIDVKKNLFDMQSSIFGNMLKLTDNQRAAELASKQTLLDMTEMQIKQSMFKYQGPIAQANAQKLIGDLQVKRAEYHQQLMQTLANSPALVQQDATMRKITTLPPEQRAQAMKEYTEYSGLQGKLEAVNDSMQTLSNLRTSFTPNSLSQKKVAATDIRTFTKQLFGGAREAQLKQMEGYFPTPYDNDQTIEYKTKKLKDAINREFAFPTIQSLGIVPRQLPLGKGT